MVVEPVVDDLISESRVPLEICVGTTTRDFSLAVIGSTTIVVCSEGVAPGEVSTETGALEYSDEVDLARVRVARDALLGPEVVMVVVANK